MKRTSGRNKPPAPDALAKPRPRAAARYIEVCLDGTSLQRAGKRVLAQIHWRIRPGQRWVLLGANGSGKTQLLKVLAGIVRTARTSPAELRWRTQGRWHEVPYEIREHIAYLGPERQDKYERYDWNLVVEELVGTGLYASDIALDTLTAANRRSVAMQLRRLGITSLARRRFLELSYGQRRMTLLARALIARPRLLLLDEVFTGLDAQNHARLKRWLARLRGALPVVLATHDPTDIPATATHALALRKGRVVFCGPIAAARAAGHLGALDAGEVPAATPRRVAAPPEPLVSLERASVYLEGHHAVRDVSLAVRGGDMWVIHGANGSGKTTLLRALYGDHGVAAGGRIRRAGILPGVALEKFRERTGIAAPYVHARYPRNYTVAEVVLSGRHSSIGLQRTFSAADHAAAAQVLRRLGAARWAQRTLTELSYGQTRRVLFARAIVRNPRLLLLDEPFDSLDAATRAVLTREILRLAGEGVAIVVTAHSAAEWGSRATHELELTEGAMRYGGLMRRGGRGAKGRRAA